MEHTQQNFFFFRSNFSLKETFTPIKIFSPSPPPLCYLVTFDALHMIHKLLIVKERMIELCNEYFLYNDQ